MAKVLLISPPFYRLMGSHYNGIHLGLGYISSLLKRNSHKTIIYNADYCDVNINRDEFKKRMKDVYNIS
jgi:hypothetical protein